MPPSLTPPETRVGQVLSFDLLALPLKHPGDKPQWEIAVVDHFSGSFHFAQCGASKSVRSVFDALRRVIAVEYTAYGHTVKEIRGDNEAVNVALRPSLGELGIAMFTTPAGEHCHHIERYIGTFRARVPRILSALPYHLPGEYTVHLHQQTAAMLNRSVTPRTFPDTPDMLRTGKSSAAPLQFGACFMVHCDDAKRRADCAPGRDYRDSPKVEIGVCLGACPVTGQHKFLLANGKIVPRHPRLTDRLSPDYVPFGWQPKSYIPRSHLSPTRHHTVPADAPPAVAPDFDFGLGGTAAPTTFLDDDLSAPITVAPTVLPVPAFPARPTVTPVVTPASPPMPAVAPVVTPAFPRPAVTPVVTPAFPPMPAVAPLVTPAFPRPAAAPVATPAFPPMPTVAPVASPAFPTMHIAAHVESHHDVFSRLPESAMRVRRPASARPDIMIDPPTQLDATAVPVMPLPVPPISTPSDPISPDDGFSRPVRVRRPPARYAQLATSPPPLLLTNRFDALVDQVTDADIDAAPAVAEAGRRFPGPGAYAAMSMSILTKMANNRKTTVRNRAYVDTLDLGALSNKPSPVPPTYSESAPQSAGLTNAASALPATYPRSPGREEVNTFLSIRKWGFELAAAAEQKELTKIFVTYRSLRLIDESSVEEDAIHLQSLAFHKKKRDGSISARFALNGKDQPDDSYDETFSSTSDQADRSFILSAALADAADRDVLQDLQLGDCDIPGAFLHNALPRSATGGRQLVTRLPFNLINKQYAGKLCEVTGCQYGLKQSNHIFCKDLADTLVAAGYAPLPSADSIFIKRSRSDPLNKIVISTHVDDFFIVCNRDADNLYDDFKRVIHARYGPDVP